MRPADGQRLLCGLAALLLAGCASHSARDSTSGPSIYAVEWVKQQIAEFEGGASASSVSGKVEFNDTSLYLIRSPCCDLFDYLYTAEGRTFCAPFGGFTGRGDGKCPPGIGPVSPQRKEPVP